jgi:hypothetical protein
MHRAIAIPNIQAQTLLMASLLPKRREVNSPAISESLPVSARHRIAMMASALKLPAKEILRSIFKRSHVMLRHE